MNRNYDKTIKIKRDQHQIVYLLPKNLTYIQRLRCEDGAYWMEKPVDPAVLPTLSAKYDYVDKPETDEERDYKDAQRLKLYTKLYTAIAKLTDIQQKIVKLYFFEGLTQSQIAKQLGRNQSSVTKNLYGNQDYGYYSKGKCNYGGAINK